eukprot:TRINITY_DN2542_c0_g1_i1.p1 TRINITY_DN2542_c0_g1~~TRINITY_DN2542_c0_g1_i1.p1  ORF type:complete len:250 (-),score=73.89 TRINITY_DN2542_c0_g1_i1:241-990(-)
MESNTVPETSTETDGEQINTLEPNYGCTIRFIKRVLIVNVTLHKIPPKFVNLDPTETEFYLDTLGFSKKYKLRFSYPQDIQVDVDESEAELEYGILKVTFPITQIRDKKSGKLLRKKRRKRKAAADDNSPAKKPKTELNMERQLEIISEINSEQNKKIEESLQKEAEKNAYLANTERNKSNKKAKQKRQKEQVLDSILKKQQEQTDQEQELENKKATAASRRKVTFNNEVEVQEFHTKAKIRTNRKKKN